MNIHKGVHHGITDYTKCVETNGTNIGLRLSNLNAMQGHQFGA